MINEEQERAIKRVDRALKNFDACGLTGFVAETGIMHVFIGSVPMDGLGGAVNVEKEVGNISTEISVGAY